MRKLGHLGRSSSWGQPQPMHDPPLGSDRVDGSRRLVGGDRALSMRRLVLLLTALTVAGLAAVFAWLGWDQAGRVATVLSGLVAVAALGVAVWAALPRRRSAGSQTPLPGDTAVGDEAGPTDRDPTIEQHAEASDQARIYQAGHDQHITAN